VVLAAEQAVPEPPDLADLVRAMRLAGGIGADEDDAIASRSSPKHGTDPANLLWQGGAGGLAFDPAIWLEDDPLMVWESSFPVTAAVSSCIAASRGTSAAT
jgi:hypothetical protein